ncbi:hypothetical protein ACFE04_029221 [Oxalis oulophora]
MKGKVICSITLIVAMFVSIVVAEGPAGYCAFKSKSECINACKPGCDLFLQLKDCDLFCEERCSPCLDAPPSSNVIQNNSFSSSSDLPSLRSTSSARSGDGPACYLPNVLLDNVVFHYVSLDWLVVLCALRQ